MKITRIGMDIAKSMFQLHLGLLPSFGWLVSLKPPVWHLDAFEGGGVHSIDLRGLKVVA